MQELKVIGVEDGALVAASDEGARFRIEIDEVLRSRIRQAAPPAETGPKLSPREVQAHIRSGLSAEEVAELTGASVDYIRRFEGLVIAEREHIVTSALAVPRDRQERPRERQVSATSSERPACGYGKFVLPPWR